MTNDLESKLQRLHAARAAMDDDLYAEQLDRLRARYGAEAVNALLHQPDPPAAAQSTRQEIGGNAQVDVAIAGNQYGHIFINGRRTKDKAALLAGYLARLAGRCATLPIQVLADTSTEQGATVASLEQIYTQLATTNTVPREVLDAAGLADFDAAAYYAAHVGEQHLPDQRRTQVRVQRDGDSADTPAPARGGDLFGGERGLRDLESMTDATLRQALGEAREATFFGPQLVTEAIAAERCLVLLGEPGGGKSTALRHLALILAQAALDEAVALETQVPGWNAAGPGRLLPIFLPLLPFARRLAQDGASSGSAADLWNEIAERIGGDERAPELAAAVHDELEAGTVLLLLDGLDEVAGAESRRKVVRAVAAFARDYPRCRMVVACRVRAYLGEQNAAWRLPEWPTVTLDDWTRGQMERFITAWYRSVRYKLPDAERERRREDLLRALRVRDDLQRLGRRPLLLTITALVHLNDGRLPEERVSLYSRCVDILLGRWELGRQEDGYVSAYGTLLDYIGMPDADLKSLRPLLQTAAFRAHAASDDSSLGSLRRDTLRLLVADTLKAKGHPDALDGAERFLDYTDKRAGILHARDAGDAYSFPHQTFQEYLAGLELVRGVQFIERILELRDDDRWRVPILLGVGHLVNETTFSGPFFLLKRLMFHEDDEAPERYQRDLLLAAEIGGDVGWDRLKRGDPMFGALRQELAGLLVEVVEGTVLPAAERVQAGVYLSDLGDPRPGICSLPPPMVPIAGGSFVIGSTPEEAEQAGLAYEQFYRDRGDTDTAARARRWPEDEINDQALVLPDFAIARYPVTNAQYARFIEAGGYESTAEWWDDAGRAWLHRNDAATEGLEWYQRRDRKDAPEFWDDERVGHSRPNHPVVGISWYEAMAFCCWLTRFLADGFVYTLPSEAEWEYVARGRERRAYPWGSAEPDAERANFNQHYGGTTAAGCFSTGATPEGIHDLAGNVWEWTRSIFRDYPYDPADGREDSDDPAQKTLTTRGGGWDNHPINLRAANRGHLTPDLRLDNLGFRLARHVPATKV